MSQAPGYPIVAMGWLPQRSGLPSTPKSSFQAGPPTEITHGISVPSICANHGWLLSELGNQEDGEKQRKPVWG